jgi:hypothetical protein
MGAPPFDRGVMPPFDRGVMPPLTLFFGLRSLMLSVALDLVDFLGEAIFLFIGWMGSGWKS